MANTYSQIHIHTVFTVQFRASLIQSHWEDRLYKYINEIIQFHGHKTIAINGMPDHVHLFFAMRPSHSLSELVQIIKSSSSKWVNDQRFLKSRFEWQAGFGAFSYSKSQVHLVANYIDRQKFHHQKKTFLQEYRTLLEKSEIDFDERCLFTAPE